MGARPSLRVLHGGVVNPAPLHPDDRALFQLMHMLAFAAAAHFNLPLREFEPKRRPSPGGAYGLCNLTSGTVSILFRCKHSAREGGAWFRSPSTKREVVETVAHELAHFRDAGHGVEHKAFTTEIRAWLEAASLYAPSK